MTTKKNEQTVSNNLQKNRTYMETKLGIGITFDIGIHEVSVLNRKINLYYVNGLVHDISITELLKEMIQINDSEVNEKNVWDIIENRLVSQQVEVVDKLDEVVDQLLSGLIIILVDGFKKGFAIDVRAYPGRSPEEPDTERVIRGSRDGFTENIIENVALVRRRIRDANLRNEILSVGERSKTDVCIGYIKDIANDDLIRVTKEKIKEINIDGITMADKAVEEFISEHKWNPYPMVRYTERPDVAANHLLEGHLILIVDTSPSIIILPTTFFDHLEHAEEYRQTPAIGTSIRWIRFLAIFASLFILPLWLLFADNPSLLPKELAYIGPNEEGNISITIQILLAILGVEFLRMAAVHTPTSLATAMGLIAAVLIGEIAVDVGMFSPEVILYVAISTIGNYVTPSYELSVANKIISVFFILMSAFFGESGFMIAIVLVTLLLANLKSLKTPYLWPLLPFNAKAMFHVIFRVPVPYSSSRPSFVHPKNTYRQPLKKK